MDGLDPGHRSRSGRRGQHDPCVSRGLVPAPGDGHGPSPIFLTRVPPPPITRFRGVVGVGGKRRRGSDIGVADGAETRSGRRVPTSALSPPTEVPQMVPTAVAPRVPVPVPRFTHGLGSQHSHPDPLVFPSYRSPRLRVSRHCRSWCRGVTGLRGVLESE